MGELLLGLSQSSFGLQHAGLFRARRVGLRRNLQRPIQSSMRRIKPPQQMNRLDETDVLAASFTLGK